MCIWLFRCEEGYSLPQLQAIASVLCLFIERLGVSSLQIEFVFAQELKY